MSVNWYDVLDVEPTATTDEIRAAWRAAVADLDPTSRRFRLYNEAAEVLLDRARRAAYDKELERGRSDEAEPRRNDRSESEASLLATPHDRSLSDGEATDETPPGEEAKSRRSLPLVPGWLLVGVAALVAVALVAVGVLLTKPADASVADDTEAAQSAAERAIVPILSYDAHHLDRSEAAATAYMTDEEKQQYDKLFAVVRQNAPRLGTVIKARYVASGIVRSGTDRVDVLVFVDQITRNKAHPTTPVIFKNQATVTMAKVGGTWLVDNITTTKN